jgi:hypothetical protein
MDFVCRHSIVARQESLNPEAGTREFKPRPWAAYKELK